MNIEYIGPLLTALAAVITALALWRRKANGAGDKTLSQGMNELIGMLSDKEQTLDRLRRQRDEKIAQVAALEAEVRRLRRELKKAR